MVSAIDRPHSAAVSTRDDLRWPLIIPSPRNAAISAAHPPRSSPAGSIRRFLLPVVTSRRPALWDDKHWIDDVYSRCRVRSFLVHCIGLGLVVLASRLCWVRVRVKVRVISGITRTIFTNFLCDTYSCSRPNRHNGLKALLDTNVYISEASKALWENRQSRLVSAWTWSVSVCVVLYQSSTGHLLCLRTDV